MHASPSIPLQQAVAASEAELVEPLLQAVFGLRLAFVGNGDGLNLLDASPIEYRVHVLPQQAEPATAPVTAPGMPCVMADDGTIPLLSEAFDAVVLYHALEQSEDPHTLLREAERILRPSGFLVMVCYNPASLLGLAHRLGQSSLGRGMHLLGMHRLRDWLKLLGLRPLSGDYGFYRYPWLGERALQLGRWLERLGTVSRAPLGGISVLLARKDVFGMTALGPQRQARRLSPGLLLPARVPMPNRQYQSNNNRKYR